jgi:hypothetical protein
VLRNASFDLDSALHKHGFPPSFTLFGSTVFDAVQHATAVYLPPSPPPAPPKQPPPSPPPLPPWPPSPPPGLCSDTCNAQGGNEGECNDGGPEDLLRMVECQLGSDCSDCGVRIFCVDCPEACQAKAIEDPAGGCMQSMWGDSICDPNCNNLACNHDDCTSPQIIEKCVNEQDVSGVGFSEPPLAAGQYKFPYNEQLVPMNMQLDIKPARLEIRMDINEMVPQR